MRPGGFRRRSRFPLFRPALAGLQLIATAGSSKIRHAGRVVLMAYMASFCTSVGLRKPARPFARAHLCAFHAPHLFLFAGTSGSSIFDYLLCIPSLLLWPDDNFNVCVCVCVSSSLFNVSCHIAYVMYVCMYVWHVYVCMSWHGM